MADPFEEQGGAATMDPPAPVRWLMSKILSRILSPKTQQRRRAKAEAARRKAGERHRVEYFHQIDDSYSQLAAQLLRPLLERYDVELICHLTTVAHDRNLPEPELLVQLSRYDCTRIAPHYGLRFPEDAEAPEPKQVELASRVLANVDQENFPEAAVALGDALWSGNIPKLDALAAHYGTLSREATDARIERGNRRRAQLKHYSAGMLYCDGEWYWGADRFDHLENRLIEAGARRASSDSLICPRPPIEAGPLADDGSLTLEFYPSLRSPYTSLIFDSTVDFARDVGIELVVRPVLPMVMRGVPVTRMKGLYIMNDSAREAAALGLDWGKHYDPIGEPVRNCYSLFPWAREQGKGTELLGSFFRAAFFDGVNTNNERGMKTVVENAGLSWDAAKGIMGNKDWYEELEANRLAMYEFGSWGVPSYRLLDARGGEVMRAWGQDRLWLVARDVQRLLAEDQQNAS